MSVFDTNLAPLAQLSAGGPRHKRPNVGSRPIADIRIGGHPPETMPLTKYIPIAFAVAAGAALFGGLVWYQQDRTGMLGALCEAGLPNLSRPSAVDADDLGCEILGPRRRLTAVLLTGFEASNLLRSDLPAPPKGGGFTGGTWMTCNQLKGCDKKLEKQLAQAIPGLCGIGLANVVAFGWATETPGNYGHLGIYGREFFVDEVVEVAPPPSGMLNDMRRRWAEAGIGNCP